nr:uncharacterized protein LOC113696545 [Coffea arabica]
MLKGHSIWEVNIPVDSSWIWRKLLQLRPLVQPLIKPLIGNGHSTFSWLDNWHPLGPLYLNYPESLLKAFRLTVTSKVGDFISNDGWCWPSGRRYTAMFKEFQFVTLDSLLQQLHRVDCAQWNVAGVGEFSVKSYIKELFGSGETVAGFPLRLCLLYRGVLPWEQEVLRWCQHAGAGTFSDKVRRLALASSMWHIWHEKNRRILQSMALYGAKVMELIVKVVQNTGTT